jgi:hypothetical protein
MKSDTQYEGRKCSILSREFTRVFIEFSGQVTKKEIVKKRYKGT